MQRGMFDIFSHLVNGLVLASAVPVPKCDISKVAKLLPQSELKDHLNELLSSEWFSYVVGSINTTKHRWLIQHQFSVSFEESSAGIWFDAFEYAGKHHPSYWSGAVLQGVLNVKNTMIACGRSLNRLVLHGNA
jgi:hypothetical protein